MCDNSFILSKPEINPKVKFIFSFLAIAIILATAIYLVLHGQSYFSRRELKQTRRFIRSFGMLSPLVLLLLILLSTLVPPLPLPIPLLEIAGGMVLGFWGGFVTVWLSQIFSSFAAFQLSRRLGRKFMEKFTHNKIVKFYEAFLKRRGPVAVLMLRATMGTPFNSISYLAGLTQMRIVSFLGATILGTIPEALIFTFIGSRLRSLHLNLWYLFVGVVIIGAIGSISTLLTMRFVKVSVEQKTADRS